MFNSFFSTTAPDAQNFHPVTSNVKEGELFGELTPKDTEWTCAGSFATETQVWYSIGNDGTYLMCQIIHSSVGVWYPQIQFTCKVFNAAKNIKIWKSVNISNFVTPPPGLDKRSSKSDQFSVTHKAAEGEFPESYTINANLGKDLQIALDVRRPAGVPGWKVGQGEKGGFSYFGADEANPEGYVIHRFWPRTTASGHIIINGAAEVMEGTGVFIHAIQGMRPNLVAARWNFAHFQSDEHGGVVGTQMEFTTTDAYGKKGPGTGNVTVSVGSLVVGGKLAAVTAETKWPGEEQAADAAVISRATHTKTEQDADTGYKGPTEVAFEWKGPSIIPETPGTYAGKLVCDVGPVAKPHGLVDKVDVLAEIPYAVKMVVNYVAGTKPYIYQWMNPATITITEPGKDEPVEVKGILYNEATFIS
ncbi:oxidative stress survival, Svf1-like protein [Schizophyllum amplum]|uniref:Oxidative stress survival, Svf1-like protein n=1 Tax=Schizophyllum amplum TaxID=97359 RepID=A0A550CIY5_9AGAR|nr:oxidative stress survival, Svf1-like protein [Auriculariopsis ampla]